MNQTVTSVSVVLPEGVLRPTGDPRPLEARPAPEMLTVLEFAKRLGVSRATVFNWMRGGVLVQGLHYFRRDRVLRFPWSEQALVRLMQGTTDTPAPAPQPKTTIRPPRSQQQPSINWEY